MSEAWFGLLGAAIGGVCAVAGSFVVGWLTDRREEARWKREERARFHDERLNVYVEFHSLADETQSAGDEDPTQLHALHKRFLRAALRIELITSSEQTRSAAKELKRKLAVAILARKRRDVGLDARIVNHGGSMNAVEY